MNIITLGLKYIKKELSQSKDPIAMDSMDVINDLESASEIAVTTLDDILIYEKLSSNILELEKITIGVKRFIKNTIQPFYTQVIILLLIL